MELNKNAKAILTVNTHQGFYQYQRLPYGMASAPAIFQSLMDGLLKGIPQVGCYIDDVIIGGSNANECWQKLEEVLTRLQDHNVTLRMEKCKLFCSEVRYLGHGISAEGIKPLGPKVRAIKDAPEPTNSTELKSFLGMVTFYSKFLSN